MAVRLTLTFWALMALAGLAVEGIFTLFDWIPTHMHEHIAHAHFEWNYTTFLNIVFFGVLVSLLWLSRNRERFGSGANYAIDPVCGMQVEKANAPATATYEGRQFWFCADRCRERFEAAPARFAAKGAKPEGMHEEPVQVTLGRRPPEPR
jgi:YHS domain-containing protein